MNLTLPICLILSTLMSWSALASNALRGKDFHQDDIGNSDRKVLKINKEFTKQDGYAVLTQKDIMDVVPMNMGTTNEGNLVRDRILAKSASSIAKSPMIRNSFLMKTAKKVEQKTQLGVEIKPQPTVMNAQPVQHKFNVDIQAFKRIARMTYKGYIDSRIEYKAEEDQFQISIEEKISDHSKIALSHTKNRIGKHQYIHYQLNW